VNVKVVPVTSGAGVVRVALAVTVKSDARALFATSDWMVQATVAPGWRARAEARQVNVEAVVGKATME